MMINNKKRGQVTIFVIIGIVIALAASLFFVVSNSLSDDRPKVDIPDVSLEARPAVTIVKSCLNTIANDALTKIGNQGGMLYPPDISYPPYRGGSVVDASNTIPFWRHLTDCDNPNGCEEINIPPLCKPDSKCYSQETGANSIEEQLELYVVENIDTCINEFTTIDQAYDVKLNGEPKVKVSFKPGQTDFLLNYPLLITSLTSNNIVEYDNYLEEIPVDLIGVYDLAKEIIAFERATNYYERQTMNLIEMYSGLDTDLLPPTSEVNFQLKSFIPWISYDVKETIKYDLLPFMNFITFPNAENFVFMKDFGSENSDSVISQGIYSSFNPKLNNEVYPYEVHHIYNYDEIFLQIDDGAVVIKPRSLMDSDDSLIAKLSGLAIQDYRFNYHISYPLIIKVSDPFGNDYKGYDFQFAVEVNIRNNIPAYQNFTYVAIEPSIDAIGLADFNQRLPQKITLKTYDQWTDKPLSDVLISYVCGDEYVIGSTVINFEGEAILETTLPYCELGGFIKYDAQGYLGESIPYNNRIDGKDASFNLRLWPEQEKEIILKKRNSSSLQAIKNAGTNALSLYTSSAINITANQTVFVNIERQVTSPYDTIVPLPGFVSVEGKDSDYLGIYESEYRQIETNFQKGLYNESTKDVLISLLDEQYIQNAVYADPTKKITLKLVPGTYSMDGTLIDKTGFTIPEMTYEDFQQSSEEDDVGLMDKLISGLIMDTEDFVLEEQTFSTWVLGGVKTNFTITPVELYNDRPLVIYILEQDIPKNWIDLSEYESIEDYQEGKEMLIKPYVG